MKVLFFWSMCRRKAILGYRTIPRLLVADFVIKSPFWTPNTAKYNFLQPLTPQVSYLLWYNALTLEQKSNKFCKN